MKLEGWERRLQAYLDSVGPFEWGKTDCCMFALGGVSEAITGVNHGKDYDYSNAIAAARYIRHFGGVNKIAEHYLGKSKPPSQAQRGDIVSFESGNGIALGVCLGGKIAAMQAAGLIYLPISKAIEAWSL